MIRGHGNFSQKERPSVLAILHGFLNSSHLREEKMLTLKGRQGKTVLIDGSTVNIVKKGWLFASQRQKAIPIRNISSVEVKKPGAMAGFIQFSIAGGVARDSSFKFTGGTLDALKDEHSVLFSSRASYKVALSIKEYVENYTEASLPSNVSVADEILKLKGLMDQGIVSPEEFEAKKRQLLGLPSESIKSFPIPSRQTPPPLPSQQTPPLLPSIPETQLSTIRVEVPSFRLPSFSLHNDRRGWRLIEMGVIVLCMSLYFPAAPLLPLLFGTTLLFFCFGVFVPQLKDISYRALKINSEKRWSKGLRLTTYGMSGIFFLILASWSFEVKTDQQRNAILRTTEESGQLEWK